MSTIKAIIWDVDGVFVDTEEVHWQSWQRLFKELGYDLSMEVYTPLVGHPGPQNMAALCDYFGVQSNQADLIKRRHAIFKELCASGIPVIENNAELARAFHREFPHILHSAASSSQSHFVRENLTNADVVHLMRVITSTDDRDDIKRKPAPDLYLSAIDKLGIDPDAIIAFEDSNAGVASATSAGLRCIALPNALTSDHDFSLASFIIANGAERTPSEIIGRSELA